MHDDQVDDVTGEQPKSHDRRQLLKKAAVGSAAAGVVWAAPKVEGLSLRPNYAAAASAAGGAADAVGPFTANASGASLVTIPLGNGNVTFMTSHSVQGLSINSFAFNGTGTAGLVSGGTTANPAPNRGPLYGGNVGELVDVIFGYEGNGAFPYNVNFQVRCA